MFREEELLMLNSTRSRESLRLLKINDDDELAANETSNCNLF